MGLLMGLWPPRCSLPAVWWVLAGVFVVAGAAVFLPAQWFGVPEWRNQLEALGLETGPLVAIQSRMAAEGLALYAIMVLVGFWLAGHRATSFQLRVWALLFAAGVACYAVLSKVALDLPHFSEVFAHQRYGFFPNRNHTATYLSMGAVCGLGCTLQALRDKRFGILALALAATAICMWAIASWSISRAGVVLTVIGGVLWFAVLGHRYLGRHGVWAVALIAVTAAGLFLIANTEVRERIESTVGDVGTAMGRHADDDAAAMTSDLDSLIYLDFRVPVFLDTSDLIRDFPWTGIGARQYPFIIPQYRNRTVVAEGVDIKHPESDWLFMASGTGMPATLALLALVVLACWQSLKGIRQGSDRALRAGCFIAAILVPIHGMFDVPGHRITLAWSAVFLFVLSLHSPMGASGRGGPHAWPWRLLALGLLAAAAYLARAQWGGGNEPATTTAGTASRQVLALHQQDLILQQKASAEGRVHQPDPAEDLLEEALEIVRRARLVAPLDCRLLRLQSSLALQFDNKYPLAERAYDLELVLDPVWIDAPLRQAAAWRRIDPGKTRDLWSEAIRRADRVDAFTPGTTAARDRTIGRIQQQAQGVAELDGWMPPELPDGHRRR